MELTLSVWQAGVANGSRMTRIILSDKEGVTAGAEEYECQNGKIALTLPARGAVVLKNSRDTKE